MNLNNARSDDVASYARILRTAGFRVTAQRIALFEVLRASPDHPSAEMLYQRVRRHYPAISRASVYNALQVLASLGLAGQFEGADGAARFDGDLASHVNMICVQCGRIRDLPGIDVDRLLRRVARVSGFAVGRHLSVRGICPQCRRKGQQQREVVRHGTAGTGRRRAGRR